MKPPSGEEGYALVAAVASIAVFAMMSLAIMAASRASIVQGTAEIERARAEAAAEAGITLALGGLLIEDRAFRWSIDGRIRQLRFGDAGLAVRIEDERGKVPLAALDDTQAERLFAALGLSGDRLAIVTDSFLDWLDDDDEARPAGAEAEYYAPRGIRPRNSIPPTLDEFALVRGFDRPLVQRLRNVATLNFGAGSFDPRFANPIAIGVLTAGGEDSPEAIARTRELAGQRTAIELSDDVSLINRPVSISVLAKTPGGGMAEHRAVVELTGLQSRPYVIRAYE